MLLLLLFWVGFVCWVTVTSFLLPSLEGVLLASAKTFVSLLFEVVAIVVEALVVVVVVSTRCWVSCGCPCCCCCC